MAFSKEARQDVYKKFDGHCAYCGEEIEFDNMQVDHIIPKDKFERTIKNKLLQIKGLEIPSFLDHLTISDVNHIDNLFPTDRFCNKRKSSLSLSEFRNELEAQVKRGLASSSNFRFALRYKLIEIVNTKIKFHFEEVWECRHH